MLGQPTETNDDVDGIMDLCEKIAEVYYETVPKEQRKGKCQITASSSFFVPKPFTPFQWAPMCEAHTFLDKAKRVNDKLKTLLNRKSIRYNWHESDISVLEGLLARGDRRLSKLILSVYEKGGIYDAWSECFKKELWDEAIAENNIDVDVIIGARNEELIILEEEMKKVAKNLYISTDDGSYGFDGRVTDCLIDLVENQGKKYDHAIVIGPMIMMKFISALTKKLEIKTTVSLNPIMVDGTGMCGACRVTVGDKVKFACVDGPEFDGHLVDFDESMRRQTLYKSEEGRAMLKLEEGDTHHREGCGCGGHK